jgi:hypothetical protein
MAHQYKEPIHVGSPVVVDSAGVDGIFWTGDDGVDAGANAGRGHVFISNGTYGPFDIDHAGMRVEGESWDTHIKGKTVDAIDITVKNVTLEHLSVSTTAGGGNSVNGIHSAGDSTRISHIKVHESDNIGVWLNNTQASLTSSTILEADGTCIGISASKSTVHGNGVDGCGDHGISSASNTNIVTSNVINHIGGTGISVCGGDGIVSNNVLGNVTGVGINVCSNNNVVNGNYALWITGTALNIASGTNNVCSGNRTDEAVVGTCTDGNLGAAP